MMTAYPHQFQMRNLGCEDGWFCPSCYADLPGSAGFRPGPATCPDCGYELVLSVEHEPVAVARLKETVDD